MTGWLLVHINVWQVIWATRLTALGMLFLATRQCGARYRCGVNVAAETAGRPKAACPAYPMAAPVSLVITMNWQKILWLLRCLEDRASLVPMSLRIRIDPRDIPPEKAARRLGMTLDQFEATLSKLIARGFPVADPDTGNYDLAAIERWCDARHPHLFAVTIGAQGGATVALDRIRALQK